MALSQEEIREIARQSAQEVLEGFHRYAVEYKEPESIEQGLMDSMIEEKTAADWYERRARDVANYHGDSKTIELYLHIADEEKRHYDEFKNRLQQIEKDKSRQ